MKSHLHIKCFILLLLFFFMLSVVPVGAMGHQEELAQHWAANTITKWLDSGMVKGYPDGTFRPNAEITRAEVMVLINKSQGFSEGTDVNYLDVKESDWFYNAVSIATNVGYMSGYPDYTLRPNSSITRQEVAVIVNKLAENEVDLTTGIELKDADDVAEWALNGVRNVTKTGLMGSYWDGSFKPQQPATRAEVLTTLDKLINKDEVLVEGIPKIIDTAGIYGTDENVEINYGVTITVPDVTIQNVTFTGEVIIHESVGDGEVYFENVNIKDTIYVRGGGMDSIYFNGGQINNMTLDNAGINVNIVLSGQVYNVFLVAPNSNVAVTGTVGNFYFGADNSSLSLSGTGINTFWSLGGLNNSLIIGDSVNINSFLMQGQQVLSIENQGTPAPLDLSQVDPWIVVSFTNITSGQAPLIPTQGQQLQQFPPPVPGPYNPGQMLPPPTPPPPPPAPPMPPPSFGGGDRGGGSNPPIIPPPLPPPPPPLPIPVIVDIQPMGYGTVTGAGLFAPGSPVTLTAVPIEGKEFVRWEVGSDNITTNPLAFQMHTGFKSYKAVFRDQPIPIEGTAYLVGDVHYGGNMAVVIDITSPVDIDITQLDITWFRGFLQPITSATGETYVITEEDIGHNISVWISGNGITLSGMIATEPSPTIEKAQRSSVPNHVENWTTTETTIEFTPDDGVEYKLTLENGTVIHDWQVTNAFTGLSYNTVYNLYGRYMETNTHLQSEEAQWVFLTFPSIVTSVDDPNIVIPYGTSYENMWDYIPQKLTVRHGLEGVSECHTLWPDLESHIARLEAGGQGIPVTILLPQGVLTGNHDPNELLSQVAITIAAPNFIQSFTVTEGDTYSLSSNEANIYSLVTGPQKGTLNFNTDGSFTYEASRQTTAEFTPNDSFVYNMEGRGNHTVNITITEINSAPVAYDQSINVVRGWNQVIHGHATDADGDSIQHFLVSGPTHGHFLTFNSAEFVYVWIDTDNPATTDSFTHRSWDGVEYSNIATVTINTSALPELNISSDDENMGTVNSDVNGIYQLGTPVSVIATPASGHNFLGWYDTNENLVSTDTNYTVQLVSGSYNLIAKFAENELLTFSVHTRIEPYTSENVGQVYIGEPGVTSANFELEEMVALYAIANPGYRFTGTWYAKNVISESPLTINWLPRCLATGGASVCYTPVESEPILRELYAEFALQHYSIEVEATNGGTAYLNTEGTTSITATIEDHINAFAVPQDGYIFTHWSNHGDPVSPEFIYLFQAPPNDLLLTANFIKVEQVTVSASQGHLPGNESMGTVYINEPGITSGLYELGTTVSLVAVPNAGYKLDRWYVYTSTDEGSLNMTSHTELIYFLTVDNSEYTYVPVFEPI